LPEQSLLEGSDSLLELIHATARINEFLLSGEEGVALGADINSDFSALGGSGLNDLAASAPNGAFFVVGMDSVFHDSLPLSFDLMFFDIIPQEQAAVGGTQQIL
jgi:hypothetical protein